MNMKTKTLIFTLVAVASVMEAQAKIESIENEIHTKKFKILPKNPFAFFRRSSPVDDPKYYKGYHKNGWTLRIDNARRKSFPDFDAKEEAKKICALFYNNDFEAYGREIFLLSDKHYKVPGALKGENYLDPLPSLLYQVFREQEDSTHYRRYNPIPSFIKELPAEEYVEETSQPITDTNAMQNSLQSVMVDEEFTAFKEEDESIAYGSYSSRPENLSYDQEDESTLTSFQRPKSQ